MSASRPPAVSAAAAPVPPPPNIESARVDAPPPAAAAARVEPSAVPSTAPARAPAVTRTLPRLITGSTPEYSNVLRASRIGGTVEVRLSIDEKGRVTRAQALSGPAPLRKAAERAVLDWRYQPATIDGAPAATETTVTFAFDPKSDRRQDWHEDIAVLTQEQRTQYEQMRQTALSELEAIDREIASELVRVKKHLLELQEDKRAIKQILDGASARLGLPPSPPVKDIKLSELSRLGELSPTGADHPAMA
jgi:TonB family protein